MTTVYFIRHAQSERFAQDDRTRPLTAEGLSDSKRVTGALSDRGITRIISSPYTRTIQTITDLAQTLGLPIETDEDLRERSAGSWRGDNFLEYIRMQWEDFSYHIEDGECLADVQKRNIAAVKRALERYSGGVIAAATHGTAFSTIVNYYFPQYGYERFMRMLDYMPYVVEMKFDKAGGCVSMEDILIVEKRAPLKTTG